MTPTKRTGILSPSQKGNKRNKTDLTPNKNDRRSPSVLDALSLSPVITATSENAGYLLLRSAEIRTLPSAAVGTLPNSFGIEGRSAEIGTLPEGRPTLPGSFGIIGIGGRPAAVGTLPNSFGIEGPPASLPGSFGIECPPAAVGTLLNGIEGPPASLPGSFGIECPPAAVGTLPNGIEGPPASLPGSFGIECPPAAVGTLPPAAAVGTLPNGIKETPATLPGSSMPTLDLSQHVSWLNSSGFETGPPSSWDVGIDEKDPPISSIVRRTRSINKKEHTPGHTKWKDSDVITLFKKVKTFFKKHPTAKCVNWQSFSIGDKGPEQCRSKYHHWRAGKGISKRIEHLIDDAGKWTEEKRKQMAKENEGEVLEKTKPAKLGTPWSVIDYHLLLEYKYSVSYGGYKQAGWDLCGEQLGRSAGSVKDKWLERAKWLTKLDLTKEEVDDNIEYLLSVSPKFRKTEQDVNIKEVRKILNNRK